MSSGLTSGGAPSIIELVMKKPAPELLMTDIRYARRLVEALTLTVTEHARERQLSEAAIAASLCWMVARMTGAIAREGRWELEEALAFLARHIRRVAVDEFSRRPTLH